MGLTPASYNVPRTITHRAQLTNGNVTADFYALPCSGLQFHNTTRVMEMLGAIFMPSTPSNLHIPFAHQATAGRRQKLPIKDGVETTMEKIKNV